MATEKTMTQKEFLAAVAALAEAQGETALATYANEWKEKLENKAANRKPTAAQLENEKLMGEIIAAMVAGTTYTAAELATLVGITAPKASALAKKLVEAGAVTVKDIKPDKRVVKGYTLAGTETETETEE